MQEEVIILGTKKGTPDESHFILKANLKVLDSSYPDTPVTFDVYAETAEEVKKYLVEYFQSGGYEVSFKSPGR